MECSYVVFAWFLEVMNLFLNMFTLHQETFPIHFVTNVLFDFTSVPHTSSYLIKELNKLLQFRETGR